MFLGGWDQQVSQEHFRNSSFKGALRFWWRALHYGQAYRDAQPPGHIAALAILHKREGEIFGCVSGESSQSRVKLQSTFNGKIIHAQDGSTGPAYLLGQGLYSSKRLTRNAIAEDTPVELIVTLDHLTANQITEVKNSLIALGLFGGLGSRSRRGFGSLAIQTLTSEADEIVFDDLDIIRKFIRDLDYSAPADSPLSTLNQATRIDWVSSKQQSENGIKKLHSDISEEMQLYRSFGQNGIVLSKQAERNFKDDHDLVMAAIDGKKIERPPRRIIFGLPHNYFFSSAKQKADIDASDGRRASPLFLHLHKLPTSNKSSAIQTYLGGLFLPSTTSVKLTTSKRSPLLLPAIVDPSVIYNFMDRFSTNPDFGHEVLRRG